MNKEDMVLSIKRGYLDQLIDFHSRKIVGKIMKRFEILDDKKIIKSEVRELVYESYRDFRDLLISHNYGIDLVVHRFKQSKDTP